MKNINVKNIKVIKGSESGTDYYVSNRSWGIIDMKGIIKDWEKQESNRMTVERESTVLYGKIIRLISCRIN